MPTGIYPRTKENCSLFFKGRTPHNKGKESERKIKRIQAVKNGLEIECKIHGIHSKWRYHTQNNVQCRLCVSEWQRKRKKQNPLKEIYKDAKTHAKKAKRDFEIDMDTLKEIMESQQGFCALTGTKFDEENFPSLDRINSENGYTKNNIQLVLIKINKMKSNLCQKEFINLCSRVSAKAKK